MKIKLLIMGAIMLSVLTLSGLIINSNTSAQTTVSESINITNQQVIDKTLVSASNDIEIAGVLNGDLFCFSQNVIISGVVNGDVICAASSVVIDGKVNGSVRLLSSSTTINGSVGGSSSILTENFVLGSKGYLANDSFISGTNVSINGNIARDISFASANVKITGVVDRDVSGTIDQLTLASSALIKGDVSIKSPNEIKSEPGSVVQGSTNRENIVQNNSMFGGLEITSALYVFVSLLVVSMTLVFVIPKTLDSSYELSKKKPLKTALFGLVGTVALPFIILLLLVTIIGIPLAVIVLLGYLLLISLSGPFVAYSIGSLILKKKNKSKRAVKMLVGSIILLAAYLIPILNIFVMMVVYIYGVGLVARLAKDKLYRRI